jgi:hypothetical protein
MSITSQPLPYKASSSSIPTPANKTRWVAPTHCQLYRTTTPPLKTRSLGQVLNSRGSVQGSIKPTYCLQTNSSDDGMYASLCWQLCKRLSAIGAVVAHPPLPPQRDRYPAGKDMHSNHIQNQRALCNHLTYEHTHLLPGAKQKSSAPPEPPLFTMPRIMSLAVTTSTHALAWVANGTMSTYTRNRSAEVGTFILVLV